MKNSQDNSMQDNLHNEEKQEWRDWVRCIIDSEKIMDGAFADRCKIARSTLSRFLNDKERQTDLNLNNIIKIIKTYPKYPSPLQNIDKIKKYRALEDVVPYSIDKAQELKSIDRAILSIMDAQLSNEKLDIWEIKTNILTFSGYAKGDIVITNSQLTPKDGDLVLTKIYGKDNVAMDLLRIYAKPYVVLPNYDPSITKPILIDDDNAVIAGIAIFCIKNLR